VLTGQMPLVPAYRLW